MTWRAVRWTGFAPISSGFTHPYQAFAAMRLTLAQPIVALFSWNTTYHMAPPRIQQAPLGATPKRLFFGFVQQEEVKKAFDREQVSIPYPQMDVRIYQ